MKLVHWLNMVVTLTALTTAAGNAVVLYGGFPSPIYTQLVL